MNDNSANEIRSLKMQVAKLQLESKLRRNLASELDKQKQIAKAAQEASNQKSKEIEEIASQLSKYLSPQLYDSIFLGNKTAKIQSDKKYLTVFFSDIISFTKISDNMESAPLTEMLNSYLTSMTDIAISFGGTIDKYIGDSIMIFFGDPFSIISNKFINICCMMEGTPGNTWIFLTINPGAAVRGLKINFACSGILAIFLRPSLNSPFG